MDKRNGIRKKKKKRKSRKRGGRGGVEEREGLDKISRYGFE